MSVVYLAEDERDKSRWAIKEVRREGVQDFRVVEQGLITETNMLKRLNHPHLPRIVDVIEDEDCFLIVMDYIDGISLEKRLNQNGPVPGDGCDPLGKAAVRCAGLSAPAAAAHHLSGYEAIQCDAAA